MLASCLRKDASAPGTIHLPTMFSVFAGHGITVMFSASLVCLVFFCKRINVLTSQVLIFSCVGCSFFLIGVPTSPASGGFSHENINRGQNLQCTAALLNTVHAKLYPGHTVIRSPFCRWIERSDVHWEWTNVVRAWIESWMPLAWGLVSAAALCCLALKKATLCSFFFLFFSCCVSSSKIACPFPVWL